MFKKNLSCPLLTVIFIFINQSGLQSPTWTFSADNRKMLIRYSPVSIFRHSIVASYLIYNLDTQ